MTETSNRAAILRMYRIGPIVLLIPTYLFAFVMAVASSASGAPPNSAEWYVVWPMYAVLVMMVVWHFMLPLTEQRPVICLCYAVVHIPFFTIAWIGALMLAERFAE